MSRNEADRIEELIVPHGPNGECSNPDICSTLTELRLAERAETRRNLIAQITERLDIYGRGGDAGLTRGEVDAILDDLSTPEHETVVREVEPMVLTPPPTEGLDVERLAASMMDLTPGWRGDKKWERMYRRQAEIVAAEYARLSSPEGQK